MRAGVNPEQSGAQPGAQDDLASLLDTIDDWVLVYDLQGRVLYLNAIAERQLGKLPGLTRFDELWSDDSRLDPDLALRAAHDGTRLILVSRAVPVRRIELRLRAGHYQGQPALIAVGRELVEPGPPLGSSGHEAKFKAFFAPPEQRHADVEMREARDRLRAILQALPDLLFEFDEDGVIHDFFSSRHELLTRPPEEFLGKHLTDITTPAIAATIMSAIGEALRNGFSAGTQYQVPIQNGGRWLELSAARRSELPGGGKARVIAIARDITDRKLHEQELEAKNEELLRFTYTVSHDLKSPLVTIESFLGFLIDDLAQNDQARVQHDIDRIHNAAGRMDSLLKDLLALSRIGRKVDPSAFVSLRELVSEVSDLLAGRARASQAEISGPETDLQLWGDPGRLRELLQNLIDNALKFTRPGVPARVRIGVQQQDPDWIVTVEDDGAGIDPRYVHKLFGLFEKLRPESEGTGVGLAIVKRIIEVHGGKVWIESEGEGHGTRVKFTLPGTKLEGPS